MSKFQAPEGPPPSYPAAAHADAGAASSYYNTGDARGMPQQGYNNQYPPQQGAYGGASQQAYGAPPQQGYGAPPQQGYGAPPQQGYYPQQGAPQQMYYQQQPMQQQGYYPQQQPMGGRQGASSGEGICAGIMGALACCCCLDILF